VLVVLVVLVIGIFGVALLFPGGFGSLRYTERATIAQSLARAMEEFWRAHAANSPDGIVAFDPVTQTIDPSVDPVRIFEEVKFAPGEGPTGSADPRWSGPNRWRYVVGEVVRIPPPSVGSPYFSNGAVSLYNLGFSPIYSRLPVQNASLGLVVYSASPMKRVVLSTPPADAADNDEVQDKIADQTSYGINYDNKRLYFMGVDPNDGDPAFQGDRVFKMEYSYVQLTPGGAVHSTSVPGLTVTVPWKRRNASLFWNELAIPPPPGFNQWTPDLQLDLQSVFLYRKFRDTTGATIAYSGVDPFEYRVLNEWLGIIGFNPLGASITDPYTSGRGLLAKIDYDMDDWHILHEDLVVPADGPAEVKLAAAPVKRIGDLEDTVNLLVGNGGAVSGDTLEYQGLMRSYKNRPSMTPGIDLIVADLSTNLILDSTSLNGTGGGGPNGRIDYKSSTIRFNPDVVWNLPGGGTTQPLSIAGKHVRVYYRGSADWGIAVQKPYASYMRELVNVSQLDYRQYFQDRGGFLFFPITDGGKSVLVDYAWKQVQCDSSGRANSPPDTLTRTEVGELHRLTEPDDLRNLIGTTPNWWIRVNNHDSVGGGDSPVPAPCEEPLPGSIRILGVRGASFTARVFWREGTGWQRYDQNAILTRETR
jgi:hypothetical protein